MGLGPTVGTGPHTPQAGKAGVGTPLLGPRLAPQGGGHTDVLAGATAAGRPAPRPPGTVAGGRRLAGAPGLPRPAVPAWATPRLVTPPVAARPTVGLAVTLAGARPGTVVPLGTVPAGGPLGPTPFRAALRRRTPVAREAVEGHGRPVPLAVLGLVLGRVPEAAGEEAVLLAPRRPVLVPATGVRGVDLVPTVLVVAEAVGLLVPGPRLAPPDRQAGRGAASRSSTTSRSRNR